MELRKRSVGLNVDTSAKDLKAAVDKSPLGRSGSRRRSSSAADADIKLNNDIALMLERNEIVPLIASADLNCDLCDGLWTDESAAALFEFHPSGIVCDQSCLQFAASFVRAHPAIRSRADYLKYRSETESNQSGVFKIIVEKAVDLPSVRWIGRQDPYVRLALLPWNEPVQTKAAMSGGKNPTWNDDHANELRLQHRCNSSNNPVPTLEIQIWNENYMMNHDLLASTLVSTAPLLLHPNIEAARLVSAVDATEVVRDHKFRVHSLKSVGVRILTCAVCEHIIMSTTKTQWGYRCEDCGIDVHKACMMLANTNLPCPTRDSLNDIDATTISRDRLVTCPIDNSTGYRLLQPVQKEGHTFGKLFANLRGVHMCTRQCKADDHATNVFHGDTYCRLSVDGVTHETKEVYKTADPVFDDKTCFLISHRDTAFQLELVDLSTNVVVGSMTVSLFDLLQRDADHVVQIVASKLRREDSVPAVRDRYILKAKSQVVGYVNMVLHYAEEKHKLLLYVPKQRMVLQGREEKEFAVETLRTNMDRLVRVLQLVPWLEHQYTAIITWKHRARSGFVLVFFTATCLFFNAEYMPALFFYLALIYMLHTLVLRLDGSYLTKWIAYDEDPMEKTRLFRPVAALYTAVVDAIIPPPKKDGQYVYVKIIYLPNDANQEDMGLVFSGGDQFLVGRTHAVRATAHPKWRDASNVISHLNPPGLVRPNMAPKKEHAFRNAHVSWPHQNCTCDTCSTSPGVDYHAIVYPLLQAAKHYDNGRELLVPWTAFPGLLRFEVISYNDDAAAVETLIGAATIPIVRLIEPSEITLTLPLELVEGQSDDASLTVRLQVKLPKKVIAPAPEEKKWSSFVRDALAEKDKTSTLGRVLFGALWKAKDTTKMVQNVIGRLCATVVCTQNLFNWTHPWKTAVVFVVCLAGAILFSIVPARYIILAGGLMEFIAGLREDRPPSNTARNILWNFISSLPTDMDLIQAYDRERTAYVEQRSKIDQIENQGCRRLKYHALWLGTVVAKMENDRVWKSMCLVYRPCRFIFWKSVEDADACLPPLGQLIIDSEEDIKEIPDLMARKSDDPPYIFYVLGNTGESYQEKRFFGFTESAVRDELLRVVKESFKS
ncbi:unnamed protein product [Aphanomyces euteiches]